jgi:hypothetical protein
MLFERWVAVLKQTNSGFPTEKNLSAESPLSCQSQLLQNSLAV